MPITATGWAIMKRAFRSAIPPIFLITQTSWSRWTPSNLILIDMLMKIELVSDGVERMEWLRSASSKWSCDRCASCRYPRRSTVCSRPSPSSSKVQLSFPTMTFGSESDLQINNHNRGCGWQLFFLEKVASLIRMDEISLAFREFRKFAISISSEKFSTI